MYFRLLFNGWIRFKCLLCSGEIFSVSRQYITYRSSNLYSLSTFVSLPFSQLASVCFSCYSDILLPKPSQVWCRGVWCSHLFDLQEYYRCYKYADHIHDCQTTAYNTWNRWRFSIICGIHLWYYKDGKRTDHWLQTRWEGNRGTVAHSLNCRNRVHLWCEEFLLQGTIAKCRLAPNKDPVTKMQSK